VNANPNSCVNEQDKKILWIPISIGFKLKTILKSKIPVMADNRATGDIFCRNVSETKGEEI
jgi:hypothetical protein